MHNKQRIDAGKGIGMICNAINNILTNVLTNW